MAVRAKFYTYVGRPGGEIDVEDDDMGRCTIAKSDTASGNTIRRRAIRKLRAMADRLERDIATSKPATGSVTVFPAAPLSNPKPRSEEIMSDTAQEAETAIAPTYALVEVFGHRQHYGEIKDVEIAGGKLLEVRDVDTEETHMYGAGAIFSLTVLTQGEIDAHMADVRRRKADGERWRREREERAQARLAAPEPEPEADPIPF